MRESIEMNDDTQKAVEEMAKLVAIHIWGDINESIKEILTRPPTSYEQAANELCTLQDAIYRDAKASNADMEQVEKLFALQWEQLLDDWSQVDEETK